jgi:hypothetical protein
MYSLKKHLTRVNVHNMNRKSYSLQGSFFCVAFTFLLLIGNFQSAQAQLALGIPYNFSVAGAPPAFPGGATNILVPAANVDEWDTLLAPAGWTFNFAGLTYTKVVVSSNGWLALVPGAVGVNPLPWPANSNPNNQLSANATGFPIIAPLWDDLATALVSYVVTGGQLWVRWTVKWQKTAGANQSLFYVKLDGNAGVNTITFYYPNIAYTPVTPSASIGIAGICTGDYYSVFSTSGNTAYVDSASENTDIGLNASPPNVRPVNVSYIFTPYHPYDNCTGGSPAKSLGVINSTCTYTTGITNNAAVSGLGNCSTTDDNDAWFSFIKPQGSTNVTVTTIPSVACQAVTGTTVEVYASCGGAVVGCSGSSTGPNPTFGEVALVRSACTAETLFVRVTADGDAPGKFQICVKDNSPSTGPTCANATNVCSPLPFNFSGTTLGSVDDYSNNVLCQSDYLTGQDYVFTYTPPVTQCVNISIDGTGANTYPGLFLLDGCPNDTTNSHCIASGTNASNGDTISNITLTGGQTYYIVVDNNSLLGGTTSIPFNLHVTNSAVSAPPNDNCGAAASLGTVPLNANCSWSATYTTACSTPSPVGGYPDPGCGAFVPANTNDVWFTFTPSFSGTVLINSQGVGANPVLHGGMAVYTGTCGLLSLVACSGDSVAIPFMPSLSITVTNTTVYYIRFWSATGFDPGTFQLCFQSNCSPPNDLPINAIPLTLGIPVMGDNTCSTGAQEMAPLGCTHDGSNVSNTVWYSVPFPASGQLAVRISQLSLVDAAIGAYLFPTGPANAATSFTQIGCNDDIIFITQCGVCGMTGDNDAALVLTGTPGTICYLRVDGAASWTGSFWITAISGTCASTFPPVYRKDCANPEFICTNSNYYLPNGGIGSDGNICDFQNLPCSGGATRSEVGSAWLQFTVTAGSQIGFTITPNDSASPSSNYNFFLWDITSLPNFCSQILTTPPLRCNTVAGTGKTGLRNPAGGAYSALVAAAATTRTYMLYVENQTSANDDEGVPGTTAGFLLNWDIWNGGINTGSTQLSGSSTSSIWSGTVVDTSYQNLANWKGVGTCPAILPSCTTDVAVNSATKECWVTGNSYARNIVINSGGTLRIKATGNLHVCGDFTNNGSLICEAGATITFEGSTFQNIYGLLTGANSFANLVINKPNSTIVYLQANLDVTQNFTTANATSIFSINGKYMKVGGNFTNASGATTFTGIATSTVEFNGIINQYFTNQAGSIVLNNVIMNKPLGKLYLNGGATSTMNIDSNLVLTSGIIVGPRTAGAQEVNVKYYQSAAISGHSAASYIDGKLRRKISNPTGPSSPTIPASYDFPVGDSLSPGGYEMANITFITSTLVNNLLAYFQPWPAPSNLPPNPGPNSPMECIFAQYNTLPMLDNGFWTFERSVTPSNGTYKVTLNNTGYTNNFGASGWSMATAALNANPSLTASWSMFAQCSMLSTLNSTKRDNLNSATYPGSFNHLYATVQSESPLPIELLYFNAQKEGDDVRCTWETATERDNDFFEVERSYDGDNFTSIGRVQGCGPGVCNERRTYSLLDYDGCRGIVYYRLKQVDTDGRYSYSDVVAVNCADEKELVTLHPNPAQSSITVSFTEKTDCNVSLNIIDYTGRLVYSKKYPAVKGYNQVVISIEDFADGVYNIDLRSEGSKNSRPRQVRFFKEMK